MKGKKNLFLSAAIAFVVIIILIIAFFPRGGKDGEGEEVISKRVKLNLIDETVKVEETASPMPADAAPQAAGAAAVEEPAAAPDKATVEAAKTVEPAYEPPAPKAAPAPKKEAPAVKKQPVAAKQPVKTASVDKRSLAAKKPWAINVASFPDKSGADRLTRALRAEGYNAYITSFRKDGVNYSRVRVGFYSSREDAQKAGNTIKKRHNVQSPWIVMPVKDETAKYIR